MPDLKMNKSSSVAIITGSLTRYHQAHQYNPHLQFIMRKCDDTIEIKFDDEEGLFWIYSGKEIGPGHYELKSSSHFGAKATLHHFDGSDTYEGFWSENDRYKGMWRLKVTDVRK